MRSELKIIRFTPWRSGWWGQLAVALGLFLCLGPSAVWAQSSVVRLGTVRAPEDSGLLRALLPDFEKQTGYRVEVRATTQDVYDLARAGNADLVISHYGFSEVETFVIEGYGLWPRAVFANQSALIGPPRDPAGIRGLDDAVEGFRRIAQTRSPFIVDNQPVIKQILEFLWEGAGRPERGDWYMDLGLEGSAAMVAASMRGAYTLWGLDPFLRLQARRPLDLQALLFNDPVLQRIMISVVVNPEKIPSVNVKGAQALQEYLLAPATQTRIRGFRHSGFDRQLWWPAAYHN